MDRNESDFFKQIKDMEQRLRILERNRPNVAAGSGIVNFRGAYNGATAYVVDDSVSYNGSSYVCIADSTGNLPTNTAFWQLLAEKGNIGATGATGEKGLNWQGAWNSGAAYVIDDAVEYDGTAYVCIAGNTNHAPTEVAFWEILASKGEMGDTGATGATGATGSKGAQWRGAWSGATAYAVDDVVESGGSAYICTVAHTNHVPPNASYWDLMASKGDTGATGAAGADGADGLGVPAGGDTGQVLAKVSGADNDTEWVDPSGGIGILDVYGIGDLYLTVNASVDPNTRFGGTWVRFGAGRMPVFYNASDADFDTVEETGGAKTHTLTISEMPSHQHDNGIDFGSGGGSKYGALDRFGDSNNNVNTGFTGGGGAHNNMPPYIVIYAWKRTA